MDKIFVDTNICLDLLSYREPYYEAASRLFTMANKGTVHIAVSALTFATINYMLCKQYQAAEVRKILSKFKILVHIYTVDEVVIERALHSSFTDFEDAIQYYAAITNNVTAIITRDLKDYKKAEIPVFTAEMYLKQL